MFCNLIALFQTIQMEQQAGKSALPDKLVPARPSIPPPPHQVTNYARTGPSFAFSLTGGQNGKTCTGQQVPPPCLKAKKSTKQV
jgi:hypothetical protein